MGAGTGDVLGYARVSTGDHDVDGQTLWLEWAGVVRVFTDVLSGKSVDRLGLEALLAYARKGDTLAVVRLDRLGGSLTGLLAAAFSGHPSLCPPFRNHGSRSGRVMRRRRKPAWTA